MPSNLYGQTLAFSAAWWKLKRSQSQISMIMAGLSLVKRKQVEPQEIEPGWQQSWL
jgi:hypothetical protein